MKKSLKIISIISISIFAILWVLGKFVDLNNFNTIDFRNLFVLIYLLASLKYYQLDSREKDAIIRELKEQSGQR